MTRSVKITGVTRITVNTTCLPGLDGSFTIEDRLQKGRSPPPLGSQNKVFKDEETVLDLVSHIDPKFISWCCIKSGLFPAVSIHFKFSYDEVTGWQIRCILSLAL